MKTSRGVLDRLRDESGVSSRVLVLLAYMVLLSSMYRNESTDLRTSVDLYVSLYAFCHLIGLASTTKLPESISLASGIICFFAVPVLYILGSLCPPQDEHIVVKGLLVIALPSAVRAYEHGQTYMQKFGSTHHPWTKKITLAVFTVYAVMSVVHMCKVYDVEPKGLREVEPLLFAGGAWFLGAFARRLPKLSFRKAIGLLIAGGTLMYMTDPYNQTAQAVIILFISIGFYGVGNHYAHVSEGNINQSQ